MPIPADPSAIANSDAERRAIVKLYDKGCQVTRSDREKEQLSSRIDPHGFIHDKDVTTLHTKKSLKMGSERLKKWMKMIKDEPSWVKYRNSEKLVRRIYKGIPNGLRTIAWTRILDLDRLAVQHKGIYEKMKTEARKTSPDIRQIDLDVNRTLRDNSSFHDRYSKKQKELFHVLAAYSLYNMEVGYCQGMSQLAGLLLMHLDEEAAFWAMSTLMSHSKYAMHGFFIPSFPKLHRFEKEHNRIIERFLPKLKKHFDKYNIPSSLYTIKWFMQCFLDRVPFSLAIRLWDIYMQEGELLLLVMSYNILKMHKDILLRSSMEETINLLQTKFALDFGYEDDVVIDRLQQSWRELRKYGIDNMKTPKNELIKVDELPHKPFGIEVTEKLTQQRTQHQMAPTPASELTDSRRSTTITTTTATMVSNSMPTSRNSGKTAKEASRHGVAIETDVNGYANTNTKEARTMNFVDSLHQMGISGEEKVAPVDSKRQISRMSPSRSSDYDNLNKNMKGARTPEPPRDKLVYNSASSPLHYHVEPVPPSPVTPIQVSVDKRQSLAAANLPSPRPLQATPLRYQSPGNRISKTAAGPPLVYHPANQKRMPNPPSTTSNGSPIQYGAQSTTAHMSPRDTSNLTPIANSLPASHTTGELYRVPKPNKIAYL